MFCNTYEHTKQNTISAAHCIQPKYTSERILPDDMFVRLGVYNLTTRSNNFALPPSAQLQQNVSKIYIHPDWNVYDEKYDADIAILVLSDDVTNNAYIRPVYIPINNTNGDRGYVLALRMDPKMIEPNKELARRFTVQHLNDSYAYTSQIKIAFIISSYRTFCGRGEEGSVGMGDGGGGFFVLFGSSWVQAGIVSAMLANATGHVDPSSCALYQDISFYRNWIIETVGDSGGTVMGVRNAIETRINLDRKYEIFNFFLGTLVSCMG